MMKSAALPWAYGVGFIAIVSGIALSARYRR